MQSKHECAYARALFNLAVQADQLNVTPDDRALLDSLLSISELLFRQSTRAALVTTRRRWELALGAGV